MSEEQLSALFAKLKEDAGLQQKLKAAADLDTAMAIVKEAGFDVSKADWLRYQEQQSHELNDSELESVAGSKSSNWEGGSCKACSANGYLCSRAASYMCND
jgi:predicted ribosomally synthesized peptide with nif11-like leader